MVGGGGALAGIARWMSVGEQRRYDVRCVTTDWLLGNTPKLRKTNLYRTYLLVELLVRDTFSCVSLL